MKEIRAFIQPHKLSAITIALLELPDFPGMTVIDCEGFGQKHTQHMQDYRPFMPKKRIEIFAPENVVDVIVETIMHTAYSGQHGDGKVYILDVVRGGRIRTGEQDVDLG